MISYVKNSEIDILKYDRCINDAKNSRLYAFSWYLNCVSDHWDALILNDYEAVMPLPIRKKYGLSYVYQVPWVQQLGVFSKNKIDNLSLMQFIKAIPKKFILIDYLLNSENRIEGKNILPRTNYLLPLNTDFKSIKKSYNKNRKRVSLYNFDEFEVYKNTLAVDFLQLYKEQTFNFTTHNDAFEKIEKLLQLNHKHINIWSVSYNNKLIAGLVWLKDKSRITYLLPVANKEAKKNNVSTYLLNELIKEHQNTNLVLDFEGSMVDGVAQFYKSFGAKKEIYYWYKKHII